MKRGTAQWRFYFVVTLAWLARWIVLLMVGCAATPYPQRWQFLLLPQSDEQDFGNQAC
ncbi:MAG TPA: hypothetical protein VNK46_01715 [Nitrospiraceae bacterium]|jgi:hypothetical protein|nr:hypothetical protein [Nitrospiraceae bacterium]